MARVALRVLAIAGIAAALSSPHRLPSSSPALDAVEAAVDAALAAVPATVPIEDLAPAERESAAVARALRRRFDAFGRNGDCRGCWLQRAHCVCGDVAPLDAAPLRRLYVYMHSKEVLLAVDTAKLLLLAFPGRASLVVAGLRGQAAEAEMRASLENGDAVVLFPRGDAAPAASLRGRGPLDVVVVDGTWDQARRLDRRLPGARVDLDARVVARLGAGEGRQLRPHPIKWREVSTLAATGHLLAALGNGGSARLADYQGVADAAARAQLGPKRPRRTEQSRAMKDQARALGATFDRAQEGNFELLEHRRLLGEAAAGTTASDAVK